MKIANYELRIKNWLLVWWLLLIPTQLGKHWWPEWSYVNGIRVDYLSPTLYLTDLVWGIYLIFNFKFLISNQFKNSLISKKHWRWWVGLGLVAVNVLISTNRWVAVYKWVRILQLYITVKLVISDRLSVIRYLKWVVPVWVVVESLLGWAQITKGGSLDGVWYWLGERRFSYLTVGVASWEVWGRGLVRAYGTFSHPNSMAGFLLVVLLWWNMRKKKGIWYWVVIWMGMLGIVISGSRTIWLLAAGFMIYELRFVNKKLIGGILVVAGVVIMILAGVNENYRIGDFVGGWDRDGLNKRMSLNLVAIKVWRDNPLFGVGLNNFLVRLPEYQSSGQYWLQPVHNIPLLLLTELGILGVLILIFNLNFLIFSFGWMMTAVLVTGMVDHYWVTLPQNMWLLALVVGLSDAKKTNS